MRKFLLRSAVLTALAPLSLPADGTITNAAALAKAIVSQTASHRNFDLTATANCYFLVATNEIYIALADGSGAIRVVSQDTTEDIRPGDVIRVRGTVHMPGRRCAMAFPNVTDLERLARGTRPEPIESTIGEIHEGRNPWRLLRVRGLVRDIQHEPDWTVLHLCSKAGSLYVSLPSAKAPTDRMRALIGREISIDGFPDPLTGAHHIFAGVHFHSPGIAAIRTVDRDGRDPFDAPAVRTLINRAPDEIAVMGYVKARGQVLCAWGEADALIRTDDNDTVHLSFDDGPLPERGSCIEATGLPQSDFAHITLAHTQWRTAPALKLRPVKSREMSAQSILMDKDGQSLAKVDLHGRTITLSGLVRSLPNRLLRKNSLLLDDGGILFPVDISSVPDAATDITEGCIVRVTGICVMEAEYWHPGLAIPQVKEFSVVVNDPDGIVVLSRPSWWTPGRLLAVIGALLAGLVGIFIWNAALRRAATRKGRELFREQLGHVKADLRTEERTRLAVELYDTLAQNLTGVSMEIEAANDLRGNAPQPMLDHLGIAAKALKSCRDELRNCLWDLRNQALEEPDMTKAALKTLQPVVNDSRLAIRFNVPRTRLSDNTAHAILRIVRELVVNAIRHGNASSVKVAGTIDGDKLLCSVTDDGCGFDPDAAPGILQGHFGLQGIQERIDEIGGTFEISSTLGKGTKATISVPIPHEC